MRATSTRSPSACRRLQRVGEEERNSLRARLQRADDGLSRSAMSLPRPSARRRLQRVGCRPRRRRGRWHRASTASASFFAAASSISRCSESLRSLDARRRQKWRRSTRSLTVKGWCRSSRRRASPRSTPAESMVVPGRAARRGVTEAHGERVGVRHVGLGGGRGSRVLSAVARRELAQRPAVPLVAGATRWRSREPDSNSPLPSSASVSVASTVSSGTVVGQYPERTGMTPMRACSSREDRRVEDLPQLVFADRHLVAHEVIFLRGFSGASGAGARPAEGRARASRNAATRHTSQREGAHQRGRRRARVVMASASPTARGRTPGTRSLHRFFTAGAGADLHFHTRCPPPWLQKVDAAIAVGFPAARRRATRAWR